MLNPCLQRSGQAIPSQHQHGPFEADYWINHLTHQQWLPPQPYVTPLSNADVSDAYFNSFDPHSVGLCPWENGGTHYLDSLNDLSVTQANISPLQPAGTASYQCPQPHPPFSQTGSVNTTPASTSRIDKRKFNTLSARRYRQRRIDRMSGLEAELRNTRSERDVLKVRVAKLEGETDVLREMVRKVQ